MSDNQNKPQYDPAEKVERMNRVFDRLILPMIIFTVVLFAAFGIFSKSACEGCASDLVPVEDPAEDSVSAVPDAYTLREVLLEDMEKNRTIFEAGGYTVVESENSGLVAYIALDSETEIFDNIADSSGGRYSAVIHTDDALKLTVRIYSSGVFLVEAVSGGTTSSAIFLNDSFTAFTSGSDADAQSVLAIVPAEQLAALVGRYKQSLLSLVE